MSDKENTLFGPAFLASLDLGQKTVELRPDQSFFTQGDPSDSVYCLQKGRAKLTVVTSNGKQVTITLLRPGDFFGEESLAIIAKPRMVTATAVNMSTAIKIKRDAMIRLLHQEPDFSDQFLSFLLERNMRTQADFVDQIVNSSEKRLARALLLLAETGKPDETRNYIPPITQEALAEMIGTTRSRVSYFMNRFRSRGLIDYKDRIQVHRPRLQAVLLDQFAEA